MEFFDALGRSLGRIAGLKDVEDISFFDGLSAFLGKLTEKMGEKMSTQVNELNRDLQKYRMEYNNLSDSDLKKEFERIKDYSSGDFALRKHAIKSIAEERGLINKS